MAYTEVMIGQISKSAVRENFLPAPPGALEFGRRIAVAIADSYTEEDWRYVLNTLSPERAATKIARRPVEDRARLLSLVTHSRRTEIERRLAAWSA